MMRVLAVDHGERRIGIAISDPTGTLARPLTIIEHRSRESDSHRVLEVAREQQAGLIVVGESLDEEGRPNQAGKRARRFAAVLGRSLDFSVVMWDESLSSEDARRFRIEHGGSMKHRRTAIDAAAAAVILQSYLDAHRAQDRGEEV